MWCFFNLKPPLYAALSFNSVHPRPFGWESDVLTIRPRCSTKTEKKYQQNKFKKFHIQLQIYLFKFHSHPFNISSSFSKVQKWVKINFFRKISPFSNYSLWRAVKMYLEEELQTTVPLLHILLEFLQNTEFSSGYSWHLNAKIPNHSVFEQDIFFKSGVV
jgi:hypothetical protein